MLIVPVLWVEVGVLVVVVVVIAGEAEEPNRGSGEGTRGDEDEAARKATRGRGVILVLLEEDPNLDGSSPWDC